MNIYSKGVFPHGQLHTDSTAKVILRLGPSVLTPSSEAADIRSKEILLSNSCSNREEELNDIPPSDKYSPKVFLYEH